MTMIWKAAVGGTMTTPSNFFKRATAVLLLLAVLFLPVASYGASITWVLGVPATGAAAVKSMHVQTFLSSGTYIPSCPSSSLVYALVEVQAAGGSPHSGASYPSTGGGGGGGYAKKLLTAAQIGSSQSVTVGTASLGNNGGLSSFGSFVTCWGGSSPPDANGAAGGTCSGGDYTANGSPGVATYQVSTCNSAEVGAGAGGSSEWGTGGTGVQFCGPGWMGGWNAQGYGGGGGGVWGGTDPGTMGSNGIVKVTEFCSQ